MCAQLDTMLTTPHPTCPPTSPHMPTILSLCMYIIHSVIHAILLTGNEIKGHSKLAKRSFYFFCFAESQVTVFVCSNFRGMYLSALSVVLLLGIGAIHAQTTPSGKRPTMGYVCANVVRSR